MKHLLAFSLLLAACASRAPEPDHTRLELEAARQELARDERALVGPQADGRPVDCPRATQLGDNICLLSERICALVARLPPEPANTAQCTDARTRCTAARERLKASCPR
jgi:hypothetical protein